MLWVRLAWNLDATRETIHGLLRPVEIVPLEAYRGEQGGGKGKG